MLKRMTVAMLALMLVVLMPLPATSAEANSGSVLLAAGCNTRPDLLLGKESQGLLDGFNRYVAMTKDGIPVFDVDAAVAAGEDEMIIEAGRFFNEFGRAQQEYALSKGVDLTSFATIAPEDAESICPAIEESPLTFLSKEDRELLEKFNRYVAMPKGGHPVFDVDAAVAAGEGELIIEAGRFFNEFSRAMSDPARGGIPVHGNWCGPGHGGEHGDPIDALDAACKLHDQCYDEKGYLACSCDRELQIGLSVLISTTKDPILKAKILAVKAWFTAAPCNPFA